jgi:hypothetical protein
MADLRGGLRTIQGLSVRQHLHIRSVGFLTCECWCIGWWLHQRSALISHWRHATPDAIGQRNRVVSSVYGLVHILTRSAPMGCSKPASVAMSKSLCKGTITRMNSISESGSPCRSPLPCLMGLPTSPLRRTRDDVLLHMRARASLHLRRTSIVP